MTTDNGHLTKEPLLIFGASGHAKVVIDLVEKSDTHFVKWLADDNAALQGSGVYGYLVLGGREALLGASELLSGRSVVVAIGNNRIRAEIATWLSARGATLCQALIHPSAQIARGAVIGVGSVVMAGAIINSDARIGQNVIINTGALIDHDCIIGDSVHVAPGVTLCGGINIGDQCVIGAGSVICPNLSIGKNVMVGAGSTVLTNVPDGMTVVGTPAKSIG